MKLKDAFAPWKKSYDKPRECIKKQGRYFADKGQYGQNYDFSSNHVQFWELGQKEGWAMKNWCFWIVVMEKTLESSLDSKKIKPVNLKGNQHWIFIARTDAEAPILWLPHANSQLTGKDSNAGKDWMKKIGWQRMRWLDSITDSMDMNLSQLRDTVEKRGA